MPSKREMLWALAGASGIATTAGCLGAGTADGVPSVDGETDTRTTPAEEPTPTDSQSVRDRLHGEPTISATLGNEPSFDGLTVTDGDGDEHRTRSHEGRECWETDIENNKNAFYLESEEGTFSDGTNLAVTVEYLDDGRGQFTLQYEDTDGESQVADSYVLLGNTGEWMHHTFVLRNVSLGSLRYGNDLRLNSWVDRVGRDTEDYCVASITVSATDVAARDITIEQQEMGNVFVGEEPAIDLFVAGDSVEWSIRDYDGRQVRAETTQIQNYEHELALPVEDYGYYELDLTVFDDEEQIGTGETSFASLEAYDFQSVEENRFSLSTHFPRDDQETIELVRKVGAKHVRDGFAWEWVEKEKGVFEYGEGHRRTMELFDEHDIVPQFTLSFGNPLYTEQGKTVPHTDAQREAFADYAEEIANNAFFSDQLQYLQVWNEYNHDNKFALGPAGGDPVKYVDLLRPTYRRIKEVRPDIEVLGIGNAWHQPPPLEYLERAMNAGALEYLDYVNIHPYRRSWSPEDPEGEHGHGDFEEEMRMVRDLTAEYNDGEPVPIWITEFGWLGHGPRGVGARTQAQYLVRSHAMGFAAGVEKINWFKLQASLSEGNGLIRDPNHPYGPYTPRPVFGTYAVMTRQLTGTEYVGKDDVRQDVYSYVFEAEDGTPRRVVWAPSGAEVMLETSGAVRVTDVVGNERSLASADGHVFLSLAPDPVYVDGDIDGIAPESPISFDASDVAHGEAVPIELTLAGDGPQSVTIDVEGQRVTLESGAEEPRRISLESQSEVGSRTIHGTVLVDGTPVGRVRDTIQVTGDVVGTVRPRLSSGDGLEPSVLVSVSNLSAQEDLTIQGISWQVGSLTGVERNVNETVSGSGESELEVPVPKASLWHRHETEVSLQFAGRESLTITDTLTFAPIQRGTPTIDGSIDGDIAESNHVTLTEHGSVKLSEHAGSDDLDADVWWRWDDEYCYLLARVSDDEHAQSETGKQVWKGDSIQFAVAPEVASDVLYNAFNVALDANDEPSVFGITPHPGGAEEHTIEDAEAAIERRDGEGTTVYEIGVPWRALDDVGPDSERFALSLLVNDDDGSGRRGWIEWGGGIGSGKDPGAFNFLQLIE